MLGMIQPPPLLCTRLLCRDLDGQDLDGQDRQDLDGLSARLPRGSILGFAGIVGLAYLLH
jgi:hypothetical protein